MIAHIILNVKDFKVSESFYDLLLSGLGFISDYREEGKRECVKSYRNGEHNLWIKHTNDREHLEFVRDVGLDHIAFSVETDPEIE